MKMISKRFSFSKAVVALFFIVFFVYGCLVMKDYGISVDEIPERNSSLVVYKYLVPAVADIKTDTVDFPNVAPLHEWKDRYYGVAMQLPMVAVEHLFGFRLPMRQVLLIRHIYIYLLFFIASIFFYKMTKRFTGRIGLALAGTLIFILCPRILADSFHNIKDSLFLSVFTVNLYSAVLFLDEQNWKRTLALAITTALCVNTRIVGAVIISVCLVLVVIRGIRSRNAKCSIVISMAAGLGSILFYIFISPVTWHNPVVEIINTYKTFSDYTVWEIRDLYMGISYDAKSLPWHYLFGWILITFPGVYLFLAATGTVCSIIRKNWKAERFLVVFSLLIPLLYVMVRRPVLYNGWRHFYFIYPLIALLAVWGFECFLKLAEKRCIQWLPIALLAVAFIYIGVRIGIYHPYEYAYFNSFAEKYANNKFEKDYWGITTADLLQYILDNDPRNENIRTHMRIDWAENGLTEEDKRRFKFVSIEEPADYITWQPTESVDDPKGQYYFYNKEHEIRVNGIVLGVICNGRWDWYSTSVLQENNEARSLKYNINGINWTRDSSDRTELTGILNEPITTGKISLQTMEDSLAGNIDILVTLDGQNWMAANELGDVDWDDRILHVTLLQPAKIYGVKICHEDTVKPVRLMLNLYRRFYEEYNTADFTVNSPFEVVAASHQHELQSAEYAVDNDSFTGWSGGYQEEGMVFAFTMKDVHRLSGIALTEETEWYNYPQNLRIFVSNDELNWSELEYTLGGTSVFSFPPVECRYVRMVIGPQSSPVENHWTIREILLFEEK